MISSFFSPILGNHSPLFTLIIGLGKEIYDLISKKGKCELYDLLADIYGTFLTNSFNLNFKKSKFAIAFSIIF